MKITIKVNRFHIHKGVKTNCRYCPIALAINKILKKQFKCKVGRLMVDIINPHVGYYNLMSSFKIPNKASNFVDNFDHNQIVKPFKFDIEINDNFIEESNIGLSK